MENTPQANEKSIQDREPSNQMRASYTEHQELAYEHEIAFYIIGEMILQGVMHPTTEDFNEASSTGLPYCVQVVSQALLHGLAAYGWQGNIFELIDASQGGTLYEQRIAAEKGGTE